MPDSDGRASRLERVQEAMDREDLDLLLITPSADLQYLVGYAAEAGERPTLLAVAPDREPLIVVPALEAPRLPPIQGVRMVSYAETADPYAVLRAASELSLPSAVAVSDRAWAVVLLHLQEAFPSASFRSATPLLRPLRMRKTQQELESLARAAAMADAAFDRIVTRRFAGRTEREVAEELTGLLDREGLERAEWGPIVASGPNSASPHHMTGDRVMEQGDAVILDFGGILDGYQADITRTVHVGPAGGEFRQVYDVVRAAEQAGVDAARPGLSAESVDAAARSVIAEHGFGEYFVHRTGHGIGMDTHEEPYIVEGNVLTLQPDMTFSVEPGIYLPDRFGVRIEDIVAVTGTGSRRLNQATRALITVE